MTDRSPMGRTGEGPGGQDEIAWEDIFASVESARSIAYSAEDTGGQPFDAVFSGAQLTFLKNVKGPKKPLPPWVAFETCLTSAGYRLSGKGLGKDRQLHFNRSVMLCEWQNNAAFSLHRRVPMPPTSAPSFAPRSTRSQSQSQRSRIESNEDIDSQSRLVQGTQTPFRPHFHSGGRRGDANCIDVDGRSPLVFVNLFS